MMTSNLMLDLARDRQRELRAEAARHRLSARGRTRRWTKKWSANQT